MSNFQIQIQDRTTTIPVKFNVCARALFSLNTFFKAKLQYNHYFAMFYHDIEPILEIRKNFDCQTIVKIDIKSYF